MAEKLVMHGLEKITSSSWPMLKGKIGYLCNSASVNYNYEHGIRSLKSIYKEQLTTVFSPQHGLFADAQDNMIESPHLHHKHYDVQVYSLYSEVRKPTAEMLSGIDHLIIDLQDIGTRVYTYIYTMILAMEACGQAGVDVVVLDRPNPINGIDIEGNVLDPKFKSFIGLYPIPMRHGLTIAEVALMANKFWGVACDLQVIELEGWSRNMYFEETGLPWVLPSPNLPDVETACIYPGSVLFEGAQISEGRGTVRSLSTIGHPAIEPFDLAHKLRERFKKDNLEGFFLRPLFFKPTFNKFTEKVCGGFQIHLTDRNKYKSWHVSQVLMQELYNELGDQFEWKQPPYEYEYNIPPIDILNGTNQVREWVESNGTIDALLSIESSGSEEFINNRKEILLYK